jgi:hypothetical protein
MHHRQVGKKRIAIERLVLTALCQLVGNAARESAFRQLENYEWREPDHRIIFEALLEIATHRPEVIREQLPTILTRRGFPDIEWQKLFKRMTLSSARLESWVRVLVKASRGDPSMRGKSL